jgi:outer membrane protein TolC
LAGQSGAALRGSAISGRQSLAVTQAQIEAALAAVEVARAQKRPNIDLSVTGFLRNPASFLGRFLLGIGVGVAQNLFDSGRNRSQVREAQATVAQLQQGFVGQQNQVASQIEQALLAVDSALRRQNSADVAVRASAEALRAAQLGFEAGVTTNLEVTDAQTALLASQIDSINTRFDVVQAQATLAASVGVTTPEAREAYRRALEAEAALIRATPAVPVVQEPKKKRRKFLGIF